MDGLPVVVLLFADLDGDGVIGPTDRKRGKKPEVQVRALAELEPVGREVAFFAGGVATGSIVATAGAPGFRWPPTKTSSSCGSSRTRQAVPPAQPESCSGRLPPLRRGPGSPRFPAVVALLYTNPSSALRVARNRDRQRIRRRPPRTKRARSVFRIG